VRTDQSSRVGRRGRRKRAANSVNQMPV
jgi:hypothetical protein